MAIESSTELFRAWKGGWAKEALAEMKDDDLWPMEAFFRNQAVGYRCAGPEYRGAYQQTDEEALAIAGLVEAEREGRL